MPEVLPNHQERTAPATKKGDIWKQAQKKPFKKVKFAFFQSSLRFIQLTFSNVGTLLRI